MKHPALPLVLLMATLTFPPFGSALRMTPPIVLPSAPSADTQRLPAPLGAPALRVSGIGPRRIVPIRLAAGSLFPSQSLRATAGDDETGEEEEIDTEKVVDEEGEIAMKEVVDELEEELVDINDDDDGTMSRAANIDGQAIKYRWQYFSWLAVAFSGYYRFRWNFYGAVSTAGYVCGNLMAAGVSRILKVATLNERLGSDTYKRLNVALALFALPGLADGRSALVCFTSLLGLFTAYDGFTRGVRGFDRGAQKMEGFKDTAGELGKGLKETVQGLKSANNKTSLVYLIATVIFTAVNLLHNYPVLLVSMKKGVTYMDFQAQLAKIGRLWLASGICYTLKDAADRDRLDGTTFVQLNGMASVWSMAVAVTSMLPKFYPRTGQLKPSAAKVAAIMASYSIFFGYNAVNSIMKKRKAASL